jgi:hypothetical protein
VFIGVRAANWNGDRLKSQCGVARTLVTGFGDPPQRKTVQRPLLAAAIAASHSAYRPAPIPHKARA